MVRPRFPATVPWNSDLWRFNIFIGTGMNKEKSSLGASLSAALGGLCGSERNKWGRVQLAKLMLDRNRWVTDPFQDNWI